MTEPTFGITFLRDDDEPRPAIDSDLSVIGLVGPMADAQNGIPLNDPITFNSDDVTTVKALGTTNLIVDAISGINDQLGELQRAARIVLVRTMASSSQDANTKLAEETAGIVGSSTEKTGVHAFRQAGQKLGVIPRLIAAPGFTAHQHAANEANPVAAELPAVLDDLLAVAVLGAPANSLQAFTDWRGTINCDRIIPIASAVKVQQPDGSTKERPSEGRILGIAVRRDFEKNGKPFHSWANQPVQGIVGPNRSIDFSLTDGATEGQEILAANGGIILRGQTGIESAVASGGFIYVGTDTLAEDDLWRFYNVKRGRDYIHLMFLRTLRYYLGRFNLTGHAIEAILQTMEFALRDLKADNHILGYKVGFSKDENSPEQLRLGKFTVRFAAEEPPVLRHLVLQSARYRLALDALLDNLLTQLELA
ncbi:MAG: phage tail protein [Xanthobacteraceae bacterium]